MPTFEYAGKRVEFVGTYSGAYACINEGRFYECPFLEHVRTLDLAGTYLDIGTNIGNHALFFSMFCRSDEVIGFEPVAQWRARCREPGSERANRKGSTPPARVERHAGAGGFQAALHGVHARVCDARHCVAGRVWRGIRQDGY